MYKTNLILDVDSYKPSHYLQTPPNTTGAYCYLESRGGHYGSTVFFGLQYLLKEYLQGRAVTMDDVRDADAFCAAHGVPFNRDGWEWIAINRDGRLPLRIRAVPEGTVVPTHNALMTVESTDPTCFWLPGWFETQLCRLWYPITVATQSSYIKNLIRSYLDETSDNAAGELPFKLHDFGSRGVSSRESAGIGGMAHLVNFQGSDTIEGVRFANHYYGCAGGMSAFSIPAAEHSTITAWGREHEVDAYRNMLRQFAKPGKIVAVVSDSYDVYNAVENIWGDELRDEVRNSGATVVIRPDSGHPATVVLNLLQILERKVGMAKNMKGFKVLPSCFRLIQGDGVNEESIDNILSVMKARGYSASNIAFGMGGALLQKVDRDTQKFAYKCSEVTINGKAVPVSKDPITDPGKKSKEGRLALVIENGQFKTVAGPRKDDELVTVFENGEIKREYTLDEVRANSEKEMTVFGLRGAA